MAKTSFKDIEQQAKTILGDISAGRFRPIYLLMGEETFFIDLIADRIEASALTEAEKAFNLTIIYGKDTDGASVINLCKRFPMMAERQVVIVKEAQAMRNFDALEIYFRTPMMSTILVLCYKGKSLDKRSAIYKRLKDNAVVLDTVVPRDYEIGAWIGQTVRSKKLTIDDKAIAMLAEYLGTDMHKISNEIDKLITRLPETVKAITADHIEQNIGISKDFNNFELTKAISEKNFKRAMLIVDHFAKNPKDNPLVVTISLLFTHFQRIITLNIHKWEASQTRRPMASDVELARLLKLGSPFFVKEYMMAAGNYPNKKAFDVVAMLRDFDMRSKGMNAGSGGDGELLRELVLKIIMG